MAWSQGAVVPRISGPVNETSLVTLQGNVPAKARAEYDLGEVPPATQLSHVRIILSRSVEQQAALDKYMADLQDRSSPNYHKWLTPDQFGKLYGPADSDTAAIVAWLESHGLKVDGVSSGRTNIAFSGTVAQVEEALSTSIHSYKANGEQFLSNTSDPVIPAALVPVVSGVGHLNTMRPRPQHVRGSLGTYDTAARKFVPSQARPAGAPHPALTGGAGTSSSPYLLYMVAGDAATIYDTPNSFNANFSSGTSYTGKGVTIGIGGDATIDPSIVADYRTQFLGDSNQPTLYYCTTSTPATCSTSSTGTGIGTSDAGEAYLDNEVTGGLAPGASIHYYASSDLYSAVDFAINENAIDIFSLSFGLCENFLTTSDNQMITGWWQQAAAQGIAVTVASGDNGSAGCDNNNTETTAAYGLGVSGLASTPYNIAVGGTDFAGLLSGFTNYVGTTNTGGAPTYYRTASKYIPESTWNDSVVTNGLTSANVPYIDSNNNTNIVAAGGGASSCSTNSSSSTTIGVCTGGYPKPSWQRGSGVPADGLRDLPDVSLMSGAGGDNAAWLVCTDDSGPNSSGVTVTANCTQQSDGHFYFFGFGGTSAATPAFAAMLALVQQKTGSRLGQAAIGLYDLYNGSNASTIFHDITAGNISVPCDSGTPNCVQNTAGNNFLTGYDTATGYDLATGIGSVDATQLVKFWGTGIPSGTATVSVIATPSSISSSAGVRVNVTVAGSGSLGTPTGTVALFSSSLTPVTQTLSGGAAAFQISAGELNVGSNTLTVNYAGDSKYASASGSTTVTVTGLTPTVTVTPSVNSLKASDTMTVQASVSGTSTTPTGKVTLYGAGYFAAGQSLSNGSYTFNIPANSLYGGNNQPLTVSYSGDTLYSQATGSASVSVTPVYGLSASAPAAITAGAIASSTVTVFSSSGYAGTITLACALASSPSGATGLPSCAASAPVSLTSSTTSATATVSIATTTRAALDRPSIFPWEGAGGGAVLALMIFLGFPARRRRWLSMVGVVVAMVTLGAMVACGGGGSSSGSGGGTTAGTYTFTVTGNGSPSLTPAPTATITLTVN